MISRQQAQELVNKNCSFSLQRHLFHVATALEALAVRLNYTNDIDRWYIVGLLHDIDWNKTINNPKLHCGEETKKFLNDNGVPSEWITDICSHCDFHNLPRDTDLKKGLVAVDELSGFCVAVALMRPTKMIGMKSKSVKKKFKDKLFAKNVSREDMLVCEKYFNIPIGDLLDQTMLPGFYKIAKDWKLD